MPRLRLLEARRLFDADQTVNAPSHPHEPRACAHDRRPPGHHGCRPSPALEPARRRPWIQAPCSRKVLLDVRQDVHERVPDLARCREPPCVVSVRPDGTAATKRSIAASRGTNDEALDSARERPRPVRLYQQMHVVALNREMQDTERMVGSSRQRGGDGVEDAAGAERRQARGCPQRHVDRTSRVMGTTRAVRNATPTGPRLAPCTIARTAPCRSSSEREIELSTASRHLIRH